jgi:pilus assembly protein Flp/PilA
MRTINEALLAFMTWLREEKAQTMAEYGLILALVAVVVIPALVFMAPQVGAVYTYVADEISDVMG